MAGWNVLSNPIDPTQQTDVPFGARSDYLQPWRAYLGTPPASMMRNALGINFNVPPQDAGSTADFLAGVGFKRARIELGWGLMSYSDPSQFGDRAAVDTQLSAMKAAGIRPLILLNANDGLPGPALSFTARITQPVAAGSRTVQVDAASAAQIVLGRSGFNVPGGAAAAFIATSVSPSDVVTLSQPIPSAIPAGSYQATTLRYAPFAAPFTNSGQPNPQFEQTLSAWLQYVKAVTSEAKSVLGSDNFDVEVWNELNFGSSFLNASNYYMPLPPSFQGAGSVDDQLLARTVSWIRDPANGLPDVGIGDGFANQTPFAAGSTSPVGLTAIDKHYYYGGAVKQLPAYPGASGIQDVNALGQAEGRMNAYGDFTRPFVPTYTAFFPEYPLSAIQTESMVRDLSPITTTFNGAAHGRYTTPPGGSTPPQVWITETNIYPEPSLGPWTTADKWHLQAKAALRYLSSYINKGVSELYFYAVSDGDWSMVDPSAPGGGPTMTAIKRFIQDFAGPSTIAVRRSLSLQAIADRGDWTQFSGDGTAAHPPLYNRDVVGFFPFQADADRFVVPVYVMTRNLAKIYNPQAPSTDVTRRDLPPETYRLTIGGLNTSQLRASATDPVTGDSVPVQIVSTSGDTAVVQIPLTDSPRLLTLQDG
jgi:hypothetical protein